jgi:hypothetical protein
MKLEKKHWIWIGVGVAAITTGVIIYKKRKAAKEKALAESEGRNATQKPPIQQAEAPHKEQEVSVPIVQVAHFPLKKGSVGYEVKVIQEYMNSTCKASLEAMKTNPLELNGVWDEKMEISAVNCSSIKRNEIDEAMYKRIYRDMKAANILPQA